MGSMDMVAGMQSFVPLHCYLSLLVSLSSFSVYSSSFLLIPEPFLLLVISTQAWERSFRALRLSSLEPP